MKYIELPSKERLNELFEYRDGKLFWKVARQGRRKNGGRAGCPSGDYRLIGIDGKSYYEHRLIFKYFNPDMDENLEVDHKNKEPSDNRIENLQLLNSKDHMRKDQAGRKNGNNKSGIANVSQKSSKWEVRFSVGNGERKYYGLFNTIEEAHVERNKRAVELGLPEVPFTPSEWALQIEANNANT